MTATARAATIFAPEDLRIVKAEMPPLAPGFARVRFGAGGICGSDMHYFKHAKTGDFAVTSPLILGHEVAGEIAEINGDASRPDGKPDLKVGDRVAVNPSRFCRRCARCREGRPNLCENIYFMGSASKTPHMQGGFATYFDALPVQCETVPAATPLRAAALAEPLAVCLHGVSRAGEVKGRSIGVIGVGPIGLLVVMLLRRAGAAAIAAYDMADGALAAAKRLGATETVNVKTSPDRSARAGHDVVFEVSGTAAGLGSAIGAARRGGTVVQLGNLPGGAISVPLAPIVAKEIDLRGSFRFNEDFAEAVKLIVSGEIDPTELITAEHGLDDAVAGFRASLDRNANVKVMLTAG